MARKNGVWNVIVKTLKHNKHNLKFFFSFLISKTDVVQDWFTATIKEHLWKTINDNQNGKVHNSKTKMLNNIKREVVVCLL